MAGVQALDCDSPDETRTPAKTRVDVVRTAGGATAARLTFEPGVEVVGVREARCRDR
jgi:hypothetical protein